MTIFNFFDTLTLILKQGRKVLLKCFSEFDSLLFSFVPLRSLHLWAQPGNCINFKMHRVGSKRKYQKKRINILLQTPHLSKHYQKRVKDDDEHALLNDIVLKLVCKHLELKDLLNCRQVCKTWNRIAIPFVKENSIVRLECRDHDPIASQERIGKFLSVLKRTKRDAIPCNFSFSDVNMNNQDIDKILVICGPFIKYVHLNLTSDHINVDIFQDMILNKLPILDILEIDELPDDVIKNVELPSMTPMCLSNLIINDPKLYGYQFFFEIFQISPCLEQVKVPQHDSKVVLIALQKTGLLSYMKNIKYYEPCDGDLEMLIKLAKAGFQFTNVNFSALSDYFLARSMESFLTLQKDCIETLSIGGANYHLRIVCPTLSNIHTLKLTSHKRILSPMSVHTQFPHLKHLEICCCALESSWESFFPKAGNKAFHGLKTLTLYGTANNASSIKTLGTMFPAIKMLHMRTLQPSNEAIMYIWKYWTYLEEMILHLHGTNHNIDSLFTGISITDCNELYDSNSSYCSMASIISAMRKKPSICNLKRMKKLCLYVMKSEEPSGLLTDISGYYAFAMLPQLRDLTITWSFFSEQCSKFLEERVGRCNLSNDRMRHYRFLEDFEQPSFEISRYF